MADSSSLLDTVPVTYFGLYLIKIYGQAFRPQGAKEERNEKLIEN